MRLGAIGNHQAVAVQHDKPPALRLGIAERVISAGQGQRVAHILHARKHLVVAQHVELGTVELLVFRQHSVQVRQRLGLGVGHLLGAIPVDNITALDGEGQVSLIEVGNAILETVKRLPVVPRGEMRIGLVAVMDIRHHAESEVRLRGLGGGGTADQEHDGQTRRENVPAGQTHITVPFRLIVEKHAKRQARIGPACHVAILL